MYGHSRHLFSMATDARDRAARSVEALGYDTMTADSIVAIVFAAVASEAFINELAEAAEFSRYAEYPPLDALAAVLGDKEITERGSVLLKYQVASIALCGAPFERGARPFQDFADLIGLRNLLVHVKPQDRYDDSATPQLIGPKRLARFERDGLTYPQRGDASISWFNKLETPRMAAWACDTAHEMVRALIAKLPVGLPAHVDILVKAWRTSAR